MEVVVVVVLEGRGLEEDIVCDGAAVGSEACIGGATDIVGCEVLCYCCWDELVESLAAIKQWGDSWLM